MNNILPLISLSRRLSVGGLFVYKVSNDELLLELEVRTLDTGGTIETIFEYCLDNKIDYEVFGYGIMKIFLQSQGFNYSYQTVHKYMNKELKLHSIVRRKKPPYIKGYDHRV